MMKRIVFSLLLTLIVQAHAIAGEFGSKKLYVGGGVGINTLNSYQDATGYQVLAGYSLNFKLGAKKSTTAIEVGYMNTGDFETDNSAPGNSGNAPGLLMLAKKNSKFSSRNSSAKGAWVTGVVNYPLTKTVGVLARLGVDLGDDDGVMLGGGLGFLLNKKYQLRGEYITRDQTDSLQINIVSTF